MTNLPQGFAEMAVQMAELLGIEWGKEQVAIVQGAIVGGRLRVQNAFELTRPKGELAAEAVADWLKEQLGAKGISTGTVLLALPREEVVLRRVELPNVPDDELPLLVRYQVGAKSSASIDDLVVDFIPVPATAPSAEEVPHSGGNAPSDTTSDASAPAGGQRFVLAATVSRQAVELLRETFRLAGLTLAGISATPVVMAELHAHATRDATRIPPPMAGVRAAEIIVSRWGRRLEIAVVTGRTLRFAHGTRISHEVTETEPVAALEVSRALVAFRGQISDAKVTQVWVTDDENRAARLGELLSIRLSCPAAPLDLSAACDAEPGLSMSELAHYSAPIGALLDQIDARVDTINFLAPRQPAKRVDPHRKQRVRFAVLGAALAVAMVLAYGLYVYNLSDELTRKQREDQNLALLIKQGEPVVKSSALVQEWLAGRVSWLSELDAMAERWPGNERMYASQLKLESMSGTASGKVHVEGFARDQDDLLRLQKTLMAEKERFQVRPSSIRPDRKDPYYPLKITQEWLLLKPSGKRPRDNAVAATKQGQRP